MAEIQFSKGVTEAVVPDIRVTRSRSGDSGTATFYFQEPKILSEENVGDDITGMYLVDEEGEIITREVKGKFVNGKPMAIEAVLIMKSAEEWERFLRFMERYAEDHGLGLEQS